MSGFRRLLERLDEFVVGVPNHNITPEHYDSLDPDVQKNLEDHVANNPNPIFVKDDSVTDDSVQPTAAQPPAEQTAQQPAEAAPSPPVPAPTPDLGPQPPVPSQTPAADNSGRVPPA